MSLCCFLFLSVYRVAISDKRIVDCDGQSVTFCYTPTGEKQSKTRQVTGAEFVRGFVQHVLPHGFQKIRYYGWTSANSRIDLDMVKWLVWLFLGWTYWLGSGHAPQEKVEPKPIRCAACGSPLKIISIMNVDCQTLPAHALDYLDSG
jgi:hypothetical protein